jgi:hypothetical protein
MKKFIAGLLAGILLMTTLTVFAESTKKIEAIFGRVKLVVDGAPVADETMLYDGTTYVPLRAAAEALDKDVSFDAATSTAYITSKTASSGNTPILANAPTPTPKPAPAPAIAPAPAQESASDSDVMVWLSATGSKYHSINNCGQMNPAKATQVTLEYAKSQGYEPCSKCGPPR